MFIHFVILIDSIVREDIKVKIIVNGENLELDDHITLQDFLQEKDINPVMVVVEYNGQILKRQDYSNIVLKENDQLEVLRFVGGG